VAKRGTSLPRFIGRAVVILVALGANLPQADGTPALETCRQAAALLDDLPRLRLRALSRWYRTAPVPPMPGSPDYVNGVARLELRPGAAAPSPEAVLAGLQAIEQRFGRVRSEPNAPRTLDLDLLDLDGLVRAAPDPILPHPRMAARGFVLAPLRDVAPGWVHPLLGRSVEDLLTEAGGPPPLAGDG
jgi:2-amino-4-hydroxy-6-hydroxymethyldihydropteridine diphosphokinase